MRSIQKIRKIHKPAFLLYKSKVPKNGCRFCAKSRDNIFVRPEHEDFITVFNHCFF